MGVSRYTSNRHERRRSSLASSHEEINRTQHTRRSSEGARSSPRAQRSEDELGCFSRDEVIKFIDETPLASPIRSPRRASALSLVSDAQERQIILLPHFPLTHFDREPQALRLGLEHKMSRTDLRQVSPRKSSRRGSDLGLSECSSEKGCREHRRDGKRSPELILTGHSTWTGAHSPNKGRTGQWGAKGEIEGSINNFRNSQSPSLTYLAFNPSSIGSTT